MRRLDAPRRMVSAIEGEGLFNDATALVAYRVAVAAVVAGSFSLADAGHEVRARRRSAGVAIGLAVGWVVGEIRKRTDDAQVSVTISLLTGYAAFVPADAIGASGVLATVTAGLYMGIRGAADPPGAHPAAGLLRLGHPRLHRQRDPVRADRAAAAGGRRRPAGFSAGELAGYAPGGQRRWWSGPGSSGSSPCRT